jgi:hypothetical protein
MTRRAASLAALALLAALPFVSGQEPRRVEGLMQKKLTASQKVLEAIALADFDRIARHGNELLDISRAAELQSVDTPRYRVYSGELQRQAEALVANARVKNLDGAALAYVDMTLTCVKCHKHVREVRQGKP